MLPMVVAGGLCIALSFAFGSKVFEVKDTLAAALMQIGGGSAFALMVPVLAGFIAFSIADLPYPGDRRDAARERQRLRLYRRDHRWFPCRLCGESHQHEAETAAEYGSPEANPGIHPAVSSLIVGLAMIYLIGKPVAGILAWLTHSGPQTMGTANAVLLGA